MLIYEENVPGAYRQEFVQKLKQVSAHLNINPNWLMAIINWESAQTFSPSVRNPYSNATGLIQFMPSTAIDLGTSIDQLANMTAVEQLDWVQAYYEPYAASIDQYTDLYLATFYPAAIGKPDNYILGGSPYRINLIAQQNPSFDNNQDHKITKGEIVSDMLAKIPAFWRSEFVQKSLLTGLVLLTGIGYLAYQTLKN